MEERGKEMFSALFKGYKDFEGRKEIHLYDVRARTGGVIKEIVKFVETEVSNMPNNLREKDYVAFLADLEFKNVEFMNIFELRG